MCIRDRDSVKLCDGVLVILDARAPAATYNKNLKKLFGNKPVLYVLNKSDLADEGRAKGFCALIERCLLYTSRCV